MIKVDHLLRWIRENAVSKSFTVVNGWINGKKLLDLANEVFDREPLDYAPSFSTEKIEDDTHELR